MKFGRWIFLASLLATALLFQSRDVLAVQSLGGYVLCDHAVGCPTPAWPPGETPESICTNLVNSPGRVIGHFNPPYPGNPEALVCQDPGLYNANGECSPYSCGAYYFIIPIPPCPPGYDQIWNPPFQYYACVEAPQEQQYTVGLFPASGSPESVSVLASIKPGTVSDYLVARVYDNTGQVVSNSQVKLNLNVDAESGGHHHPSGDRPKGSLSSVTMTGETITGGTGTNGLVFTFKAPAPAGDHHITASCTDGKNCKQEGPDTVWVGINDLVSLPASDVYVLLLNNNDPKHPDNHYLTLTAASRMAVFAAIYHGNYPNLSVLQLNDASLERGGIFDLRHNWKAPHHEHCGGAAIDIRANGINGALNITGDGIHTTDDDTVHSTDPMIDKLQAIAHAVGAEAVWEVPKDSSGNFVWNARHFHTRLMGQEDLTCP